MQYHQIVLLHRIVVSLFLLHYVWKGFLLLSDKKDTLAGYTSKTKIAEMILSVLFLGTGIYLVVAGPALTIMQVFKIALVFASIPLAIVGFRKGNKLLAIMAVVFLFLAYGLAEMNKANAHKTKTETSTETSDPLANGKVLYSDNCARCHGPGGDLGLGGAKNLKSTQLTEDQQKDIIKHGKGGMSAYADLTDEQLNSLIAYIKTLKQQ